MVISFNSKGHCLINKQLGIQITNELKQELKQLKGIKFPQKVKTSSRKSSKISKMPAEASVD